MQDCEFCSINAASSTLTRCCKSLICLNCRQRLDKRLTCVCGRPFPTGKKGFTDNPQILQLIKRYSEGKVRQCDRCDLKAEIECISCQMIFCNTCNSQMHGPIGFSKHERKPLTQKTANFEKIKAKDSICGLHSQIIILGCECGNGLCTMCLKQHKDICPKNGKTKSLKEFKEEYFLNVLLKLRQISLFKQKLEEDKSKYRQNFKEQFDFFENNKRLVNQQFEYLMKMMEMKYSQTKTRLSNYWNSCERNYNSNLIKIDQQIKKYNQYAELLQMFSEKLANLDYFQKKIRRTHVNLQFVDVKIMGIDQVQSAIMNVGIIEKSWQNLINDAPFSDSHQNKNSMSKDDSRLFGNINNASQLIIQYTNIPLKDRTMNLMPSHCEIFFNFIHLPYQHLKYQLQYGVGMKMKGQQVFKKITNTNGFGNIEGLNPNTKYRVRMRVAEGHWGPITQVTTMDVPKFNLQNCPFAKSFGQNIQLVKGGAIYGTNQINFGVHKWVIKLTSKTISYEESQTSCMVVGVSNRQTKKATFVGTTLNYGYQKSEIILKVVLDCGERRLAIFNSTSNQEEVYQNLPNFPLFPTIQNKGSGQILVRYNLTTDDHNLC